MSTLDEDRKQRWLEWLEAELVEPRRNELEQRLGWQVYNHDDIDEVSATLLLLHCLNNKVSPDDLPIGQKTLIDCEAMKLVNLEWDQRVEQLENDISDLEDDLDDDDDDDAGAEV